MATHKWKSTVIIAIGLIQVVTCVKFYWNIPTFMCKRHGFNFTNITADYGIIQNKADGFRGDQISILYDPGYFPALLENSSSTNLVRRNGGVPQAGNLQKHLKEFESQLDLLVPDKHNDGLIVIDFESWRPIFRQNFGVLKPYKDLSYQIASKENPFMPKKEVEKKAARDFETTGKSYMLDTLKLGKKLRPKAKWGYYAFPYCFNGRKNNPEKCPADVNAENRKISWLFKETDVILPSVYMSEQMPFNYRTKMVKGRVEEAQNMSKFSKAGKGQIYTYIRYCYTDTLKYLEEGIMIGAINAMMNEGTEGIILWGSSNDLNTKSKCENFSRYLKNSLGPVVRSFADYPQVISQFQFV